MKLIILIFFLFLLTNCSKPKTVLICGDHVCVNKAEAKQFFEENLTIEVKIIDKKIKPEINLVELNMNRDQNNTKKISLLSKKKTNKNIKTLSNEEIVKIKQNIKKNKNKKKLSQKLVKKNNNVKKIQILEKKANEDKNVIFNSNVYNENKDIVDVCNILKKCNIDEISKYLIKQGRKKDYPNISKTQ